MKIALLSDFHDFYDHAFDIGNVDATFSRISTGGLSRPEMLSHLEAYCKVKVPLHGQVKSLKEKLLGKLAYLGNSKLIDDYMNGCMDVVVYVDEYAHGGVGKIKINVMEAVAQYPNHYASEFIPANPKGLGESLRYLRLGRRQFWLRYWSMDDWRSNCGDVHIKVLGEELAKSDSDLIRLQEPLVAIDFVKADKLYAVDYNIAPGLSGSGIENFISPSEIYTELKAWSGKRLIKGNLIVSPKVESSISRGAKVG